MVADVAFKHDVGTVTYSPPHGWRITGTESQLQLTPPIAQSEAQITVAVKEDGFTPQTAKRLKQEILARLPQGASGIEWSPDRINPMTINGKATQEVEVTYSAFGKRFKSTVLTCNFAEQQLRFRVVAPARVFPQVYEPFRQSLYSLIGLK